jgi:hypothetical protein
MWMVHKCLMLIATLKDHDSLIEKKLKKNYPSNVFRSNFVVYLSRLYNDYFIEMNSKLSLLHYIPMHVCSW